MYFFFIQRDLRKMILCPPPLRLPQACELSLKWEPVFFPFCLLQNKFPFIKILIFNPSTPQWPFWHYVQCISSLPQPPPPIPTWTLTLSRSWRRWTNIFMRATRLSSCCFSRMSASSVLGVSNGLSQLHCQHRHTHRVNQHRHTQWISTDKHKHTLSQHRHSESAHTHSEST